MPTPNNGKDLSYDRMNRRSIDYMKVIGEAFEAIHLIEKAERVLPISFHSAFDASIFNNPKEAVGI